MPTLSGHFAGSHLPRSGAILKAVLMACGVHDEAELAAWNDLLERVRSPLGRPGRLATAPYQGLQSYRGEHRDLFFGRAALTDDLVRRVADPDAVAPVLVVGPSGSGKSSLLHAGLAPRLAGDPDTPWTVVACTPGATPSATLAERLALAGVDRVAGDGEALRGLDAPLLIVVDQFEELFTSCVDPEDGAAFVTTLTSLASARRAHPVRVVASLRSDFFDRALRLPPLADALADQVLVGPMSERELREAIEGPATKCRVRLGDGLVHMILRDLAPTGEHTGRAHDIGVLPMLSFALLATWAHRNTRSMEIGDYVETGGIDGAIAHAADAVFGDLDSVERELARQLFLRLVHVGTDSPDTRRRVRLEELTGADDEIFHARRRGVLTRYVDARLITADLGTVEISHEALLAAWPRLREWINDDRDGHRTRRAITEDAERWHAAQEDPGALIRGQRLAAAVRWADANDVDTLLTPSERRFLHRSVAVADAELLRERRRAKVLLSLVAVLTVVSLVAAGMAYFFVRERDAANLEREIAVSRQIAGTADRVRELDPALAAQLSVAAYRTHRTAEAQAAVVNSTTVAHATRMVRPSRARQAVAVSPDGSVLAAAGATKDDHEVQLWDLREPGRPRRVDTALHGHTDSVYGVVFSPDGRTLATGSGDGTVRLWDVGDLDHPVALGGPLVGPTDRVLAVDFSADGGMLAAGSRDGSVYLWDVSAPKLPVPAPAPLRGPTGAVQSVAFGPGGVLVGAEADDAAHVWRVAAGGVAEHLARVVVPSRANAVAFVPGTATVAVGSNDGFLRFWSVADPAAPVVAAEPLEVSENWVNAVAFTRDGRVAAVAGPDDNVRVWDVVRREEVGVLPHPEPTTAVAFRGEDRWLITNSTDGVARTWTFPGPGMKGADREISSLAFTSSGGLLADAGVDVRLWEVRDGRRVRQVGPTLGSPPGSKLMSGLVSIDSRDAVLAASARDTHDVWLWDITDPAAPRLFPVPLHGHGELVEEVRFAPEAPLLVTASDDDTVRLWDVADPGAPRPLSVLEPGAGNVFMVDFTPDGRAVLVATQSGDLLRYDITDPAAPRQVDRVRVSSDYLYAVAVSPDGRTAAVGTADGGVRLWDLTSAGLTPLGDPLPGPDGYVHALRFSPDGGHLAAGLTTGQLWQWDVSDRARPRQEFLLQMPTTHTWAIAFAPDGGALAAVFGDTTLLDPRPEQVATWLCDTAGTALSVEEWHEYVPDTEPRQLC
ncbi:WD40 repeat domain-containing protein [Actinosynnema sp. NPDC020468]|uniref:WD40 repeat domain-containing protein n=1 Tax=Actinosynnema sp. NPDC020468 TaxID=3154488 RepID=UPI0033E9BEAB